MRARAAVVGLDLSLTSTGVALHDGRFATLAPPSSCKGYARHWWIAERVLVCVDAADVVVIEGYGFARPHTLAALAELGGVVRTMLHRHHKALVVIAPSRLKAFATGKGNADKDAMLEAARTIAASAVPPTLPSNHDEADAFWLRRAGVARYVLGVVPKALEEVDWPVIA